MKPFKPVFRFALIILGIMLVLGGVFQNEVKQVFIKATKICLECIGIG